MAAPKHLDPRDLRQGDTVRLWSDGPLMTVVGSDTERCGWLVCYWWSESDRRYLSASLPPAALELVPRD